MEARMGSRITGHGISPRHARLRGMIDEALEELPAVVVQYFFSLIRERGEKLLQKFRKYRKRHCRTASFGDFIWMTTTRQPISKALAPEGCKRPQHPTAQRAAERLLKTFSEDQLLEAGLNEVYFGRGEAYMEVRQHRCSHCPVTRCMHNHPPPIKP